MSEASEIFNTLLVKTARETLMHGVYDEETNRRFAASYRHETEAAVSFTHFGEMTKERYKKDKEGQLHTFQALGYINVSTALSEVEVLLVDGGRTWLHVTTFEPFTVIERGFIDAAIALSFLEPYLEP